MFNETLLFFKEHANGIMYLMLFFIVILFVFSYLNISSSLQHTSTSANTGIHFIDTYGKNIIYSIILITILLFLFSILGYNFNLSPSSSSSSSSSFKDTETYKFFSAYGISILNVVILFIMLIVSFSMLGINFNQPDDKNKRIKRIVEIESFECNSTNQAENETQCNLLSEENCISTGCCGWLNGTTCVSSNVYNKGPNYYSDASGNQIDVTSWCTSESCETPITPPPKKCRTYS